MKTSEGGRTGAVELPDIMSLREPSSAVDFISGLQDKLLVKGSLVSCQRTEKKKKKNRKKKNFTVFVFLVFRSSKKQPCHIREDAAQCVRV